MRALVERVATLGLVLAAVSVGREAWMQVSHPANQSGGVDARPPEYMDDWEGVLAVATPVSGDSTAHVRLIVFVDLQCPVCRWFHTEVVESITDRWPRAVQVLYVHFPLPYHAEALDAARGAECALLGDRRDFGRWVDKTLELQDSLGRWEWATFAEAAGIVNPSQLDDCVRRAAHDQRIDEGLAWGRRFEIEGIPTVLVNGWRWRQTPDMVELTAFISSEMERLSSD